jgi:5-methylcytosine-specific restriction protein A
MKEFNFHKIEEDFASILEQFIKKSCDENLIRESERNFKKKLEDMDNNELLSCFTHNYDHIARKLGWYDAKIERSINIYRSIAYLLIDSRNAINHKIVRKGIEKEILEKSIIYNALLFINAIRKIFTETIEIKKVDDFEKYLKDILAGYDASSSNLVEPTSPKGTEIAPVPPPGKNIRTKFEKWMVDHDRKKPATASQYKSAVDSIARHYSGQIGDNIDLYTITDILFINGLVKDYGMKGKYREFGQNGGGKNGHGTVRNAIAAYARFLANKTEPGPTQPSPPTQRPPASPPGPIPSGILTQGDIIDNKELYKIFRCSPRGGMRRSKATNTLLLIENRINSVYIDEWIESILHYTGMGAKGDQSFDFRQNKTLSKSNENGVRVLLFEFEESKKYTFVGRVELAGKPYFEKQEDKNGKDRNVCKFPLKIVEEKYKY